MNDSAPIHAALEEIAVDASPARSSDVAFTPTVKAIQTRKGSRDGYASMERRGGWRTTITPDLAAFIGEQVSVFLATANAGGQPYIQHRGGPAGFLHVLDDNPKAHLFLIDYVNRRRVKIWGKAKVVEGDAELLARLMPQGYRAHGEQ